MAEHEYKEPNHTDELSDNGCVGPFVVATQEMVYRLNWRRVVFFLQIWQPLSLNFKACFAGGSYKEGHVPPPRDAQSYICTDCCLPSSLVCLPMTPAWLQQRQHWEITAPLKAQCKHMGGLNASPLVKLDMWQPQVNYIVFGRKGIFTVGIVVRFGQKIKKPDFS
jgi:hypothetical protein